MTNMAPCRGCEERHPKCHSDCPKYRAFRAELDEINRKIRMDTEYNHMKKERIGRTMEDIRKHRKRRMT